ncbi:MAG: NusA-like transcription termination signal-binding factor [Candidatus Aenigmarchaeota archaeon]|nr:NusA-like transcription termination signal-binding factor [Candidatus Aenigmarchaeota archaeon]
MKVVLDTKQIQSMNMFQGLTNSSVMDCMEDGGDIYFVVGEGQYGLAVGKNGAKVKNAERAFKKSIKLIEYSPDMEQFIRNMIHDAQHIKADGNLVHVRIKPSSRSRIIGKNGSNIRIMNHFLKRLFGAEMKIK